MCGAVTKYIIVVYTTSISLGARRTQTEMRTRVSENLLNNVRYARMWRTIRTTVTSPGRYATCTIVTSCACAPSTDPPTPHTDVQTELDRLEVLHHTHLCHSDLIYSVGGELCTQSINIHTTTWPYTYAKWHNLNVIICSTYVHVCAANSQNVHYATDGSQTCIQRCVWVMRVPRTTR